MTDMEQIIVLGSAWFYLFVLSLGHQSHIAIPSVPSGCNISSDVIHNGIKVNCAASGLLSTDLPRLRIANATTLDINFNEIYGLKKDSFQGVPNLVRLLISGCELHSIHPDAFRGLNQLRYLDLYQNHLRFQEDSLPFHVFDATPNLNTLVISGNEYSNSGKTYSQSLNIFHSMSNITTLFIDSFKDLLIGHDFLKLQKLHKLHVSCRKLETVYNTSLEGLANSSVKELILDSGVNVFYKHFDTNVFAPLPNLDRLEISRFYIGNDRLMESMKGLKRKTIDSLVLYDMGQTTFSEASAYKNWLNGYVSDNKTRYLSQICVHNFVWSHSHIKGMETEQLFKKKWPTCLKSLDLSENHIFYGHMAGVYRLTKLRSLERICTSRSNYPKEDVPFWKRHHYSTYHQPNVENSRLTDNSLSSKTRADVLTSSLPSESRVDNSRFRFTLLHELNTKTHQKRISTPKHLQFQPGFTMKSSTPKHKSQSNMSAGDLLLPTGRIMWLPPKLKIVIIDNLYSLNFEGNVNIHWPNTLQELYIRDMTQPANRLNGTVYGLRALGLLNIAGSDIRIRKDLFHNMPSLKKLVIRKTQVDPEFLQTYADHLFIRNFYLEYLDLSDNGLNSLPSDTFKRNPNLRYLCLASNRFSKIPFDLTHTPKLEILDLRSNSFTSLSKLEQDTLDAHREKVQNFTILLEGNALLCTCTTHIFVFWLSRTSVLFDKGGNFSCSMDDGVVNYMKNVDDVDIQRRRCEGQTYFMTSLSVAFALVAAYMGVFLMTRYKKFIISKVLRVITPGFKILSREDFVYDVFVGYSDADVMFVRYTLLPYLEDVWKLRTFIHHRDLLHDPLDMTRAIRDSWRCVLIITDDFLHRTEMGHNVMKNATFFVTPSNLNKVLVIVGESVQYDVPDYVLQVVDEDSVIVVPDLNTPLDYETLETLRTRILE